MFASAARSVWRAATYRPSSLATVGGAAFGLAAFSMMPDVSSPAPVACAPSVCKDYSHLHPRLTVLESRAVTALFTKIRDENCSNSEFARNSDRLMRVLAEEGIASLPTVKPTVVKTPCGLYDGLLVPPSNTVCVVSIVRAGDTLLEAVRKAMPGIAVGKILIQRDESHPKKIAKLFYSKFPPGIEKRQILLVDPMLATGGSAMKAIEVLIDAGVPAKYITFVNVVSAPEGLRAMAAKFPEVTIITAAVDKCLNDSKYIVPGLGDFGDRYYGTTE